MKQVILIGKLNEVTRQISANLSPHCNVQVCTNSAEALEEMLRTVRPDMVMVSLVAADYDQDIFAVLTRVIPRTPTIVIGSDENEQAMDADGFLADRPVYFLRRPIKLETVIENTVQLLATTTGSPEPMKTVLVVDDDPTLLRAVQGMLSNKYRVTFATSGPQALISIARSVPDLILLDYDMPVCDGKMTLQMLRSEQDTKNIPVVFLTGLSDPQRVGEVLSLRPQGYLLKPPSKEKLHETIERVLNG